MSTALNTYVHAGKYVCFNPIFGALDLDTLEFIDTQANAITENGAVTSIVDGTVIIEYNNAIYEHPIKMGDSDCMSIFGELCIIAHVDAQQIYVIDCANFAVKTKEVGRFTEAHIIKEHVLLVAGGEITIIDITTMNIEEYEITACEECKQIHEIIMFNNQLKPVTLCGGNIVFPNGCTVPCMEQYNGFNNRYIVTIFDKTYIIYDSESEDLNNTIVADIKGEYESLVAFIVAQKPNLVLLSSVELQFNPSGLVVYNYLQSAAPLKHMYVFQN